MAVALHQVAAGAAPRDAITNHLFASQELFRSWGIESEIYATHIESSLRKRVRSTERLPLEATPETPVVLHYSIDASGFRTAIEHATTALFHYHNVTPAELLWRHAPHIAVECAAGRRHLTEYAERVAGSAADSAYNALELAEAGFADPTPVGILRTALEPIEPIGRSGDEPIELLFVGRGVPNKAQHDVILTLAALHETGRNAVLSLVGAWNTAPLYRRFCEQLVATLGLKSAVRFIDRASHSELSRRYATADVFVCLSDHEGFCVPLLEAMEAGLPIVAYASSAVPETVGDAGLVLPSKAPSLVAEAVMAATDDDALRASFAAARRERLAHFAPEAVAERLKRFITPVL